MTIELPKLIATSVVRGSKQGESHGGIYTVDFERQAAAQHVDWNASDIDWEGRGADRGLRGIAFHGEEILVAASDELFVYDQAFRITRSFKNRYLKHCHEISSFDGRVFLTSTGFDSILSFDLEREVFDWGFHLQRPYGKWSGHTFDPRGDTGPRADNDFHLNMVFVDHTGIYFSGLRTESLLHLNDRMEVSEVCSLPRGVHNARPWRGGVLFNDTEADCVRYVDRNGGEKAFKIHAYDADEIEFAGIDDSKVARQAFGRGLVPVGDRFVAAGSSPSTITLYDLATNQRVGFVNLSMDVRNAIHGLEIWPFGGQSEPGSSDQKETGPEGPV